MIQLRPRNVRASLLYTRLFPFGLACLLGAGPLACSELHGGPQDGTETGNPPVMAPFLNEALVALVVTADQVRVTGKPGAANPGAQVEVLSTLTEQVLRGSVASDGSFDVLVDSSPLDTFEVRVVAAGGKTSAPVFVVQGAAAVAGSSGDELSCSQRENLARQQLDALINSRLAEGGSYTRCLIDTDCTTVSGGSACNDSCSTYAISKVGAQEIALATDSVEAGLCKTFAADGCKVIIQPCAPPQGELACVQGSCKLANPIESPELRTGCREDFDYGSGPGAVLTDVFWYSKSAEACLPRSWSGVGGNANRYMTRAACEAACTPDVSSCAEGLQPRLVCISGGLAGGCAQRAMACARPCTSVEQCSGDPIGSWCAGGFCDATSPE
jgi:hypothetical protein